MGRKKNHSQREEEKLLEKILEADERMEHVLDRIERDLEPHRYQIRITQEFVMAIGNISAGTTGSFSAALTDNGSPIALPTGSTFAWTSTDSLVTFDTSASPDGSSAVVSVPAGDTGTTVTITVSTTATDGTTATGSITVALTPVPQRFAVTITQVS